MHHADNGPNGGNRSDECDQLTIVTGRRFQAAVYLRGPELGWTYQGHNKAEVEPEIQ